MYSSYRYQQQQSNAALWAIFFAIVFFSITFLVVLKYEYVYDWYRLSYIQNQFKKEDPRIMNLARHCIFNISAECGEIMEQYPAVKQKIHQYYDLIREEERIYKRHPDWRD